MYSPIFRAPAEMVLQKWDAVGAPAIAGKPHGPMLKLRMQSYAGVEKALAAGLAVSHSPQWFHLNLTRAFAHMH